MYCCISMLWPFSVLHSTQRKDAIEVYEGNDVLRNVRGPAYQRSGAVVYGAVAADIAHVAPPYGHRIGCCYNSQCNCRNCHSSDCLCRIRDNCLIGCRNGQTPLFPRMSRSGRKFCRFHNGPGANRTGRRTAGRMLYGKPSAWVWWTVISHLSSFIWVWWQVHLQDSRDTWLSPSRGSFQCLGIEVLLSGILRREVYLCCFGCWHIVWRLWVVTNLFFRLYYCNNVQAWDLFLSDPIFFCQLSSTKVTVAKVRRISQANHDDIRISFRYEFFLNALVFNCWYCLIDAISNNSMEVSLR